MSNMNVIIKDQLSFVDDSESKHGLRGHVQIFRENITTKETSLWYEDDNMIPISGYQWILMKMFNLCLDSKHNTPFENANRDTTVVVPDLNNSGVYQMGVDPSNYTPMTNDISADHFVQGFMIGNGGAGEDAITTKNSDYSFTKLRNPIPFQQTQTSLPSDISGQYLGMLRVGASSFSKSYYIKKFDERPHIYHSWWRDGQRWDYIDPVTQNDLGPNAVNGIGKTNRIETYAECKMSLSEDDCVSYFSHDGSNQTAIVNELGLVAFDAVYGTRSIIERLYSNMIKDFIQIVFNENRPTGIEAEVINMATEIHTVLTQLKTYGQSNINQFIDIIYLTSRRTPASIDYEIIRNQLMSDTNINVEAFYNQNGSYIYSTDKFLEYLNDDVFSSLTTDEAQRIKLVTYYPFNSIPLQSNWRIRINYRIYTN